VVIARLGLTGVRCHFSVLTVLARWRSTLPDFFPLFEPRAFAHDGLPVIRSIHLAEELNFGVGKPFGHRIPTLGLL
jgi:hypothetical protein